MSELRRTTCVMDCPDTCSLEVEVDGGEVVALRGAQEGMTAGYICSKVSRFSRRLYHSDRVLYPLRRTGPKGSGEFERIGWDEALSAIAGRLEETRNRWGGEAILPYHYGGSNGFLADGALDDYFFAKLGASRLDKTICAAPATAVTNAMYGRMPGVAFEDYGRARFILVWGANPKASNIHLVPFLKAAKESGAFVAVVDPQKHFSDREIDLHLAVRPGADLPLALGMIRYWLKNDLLAGDFLEANATDPRALLTAAEGWTLERAAESSGVAAGDIETAARRYAESSPAVLRCGWGVERNRNGGQALAAILAMPCLLGKFGLRGGGYTLSNSGAVSLDMSGVLEMPRWETRRLNMTRLGRILNGALEPPIRALFVYNSNPVATTPDQNAVIRGLKRDDLFTVCHEQVMTDTALFADIVLPATTFLEQYEIRRSYGDYKVGGAQPVVPAMGESKPNHLLFGELGQAMGWDDEPFLRSSDVWMERVARALRPEGNGSRLALRQGGARTISFSGSTPVPFLNVFPETPDGKIHLTPEILGPTPYRYQPVSEERYPLALISPATSKLVSSTFGEFNYPELSLTLNPGDAAQRGIGDGARVRIFNEVGEVVCRAKVSRRVRPGVAVLPKGAWMKSSGNGRTSTALCPDSINEIAGGACFNDARVEVEKLDETN